MRKQVLAMAVDVTTLGQAVSTILGWAALRSGRYVCVSNVHMCVEVLDNHDFRSVVNGADLVVADGKPIALAQRLLGAKEAGQVRGMDLTLALCREAAAHGIAVGFYGGEESTLEALQQRLQQQQPVLRIACAIAPPFRALATEEEQAYLQQIRDSGAAILFVGLGCPKQERWMATHRNSLPCVMLGVGAAFDFIAGRKKHAPVLLQRLYLEWLYRLLTEPGRLWRRYLATNPRFVWEFFLQLCGKKFP
jgi:N-acetylglucosaminyldiphosphoundecaprenol N-acetyl-beta-D-mannosaminyltransferase